MAKTAYIADLRGRVSSAQGLAHVGPDGSLCLAPNCERQLHESQATRAIDPAFADAEGRVIRTGRWARSAAAPT
jgi:hypothetical protein